MIKAGCMFCIMNGVRPADSFSITDITIAAHVITSFISRQLLVHIWKMRLQIFVCDIIYDDWWVRLRSWGEGGWTSIAFMIPSSQVTLNSTSPEAFSISANISVLLWGSTPFAVIWIRLGLGLGLGLKCIWFIRLYCILHYCCRRSCLCLQLLCWQLRHLTLSMPSA